MLIKRITQLFKVVFFATGLTLVSALPAIADVFVSADFRITPGEETGSYVLNAQLPTAIINNTDVVFPESCTLQGFNRQAFADKTQLRYDFQCTQAFNQNAAIITPWFIDGAKVLLNIDGQSTSFTLKRSLDTTEIPLNHTTELTLSKSETVKRYLWQGMLHIWFGWDHLAFVLCLCLLASHWRLLTLITTFTVGHSLTLALAYYQVVNIPIAPIEILIAFSIMLMAREALVSMKWKRLGLPTKALTASVGIVLLFGLIHGLGFASALSELGVPQNEIGLALLFFNLGVEAGQILFIAALYALSRVFLTLKNKQIDFYLRISVLYVVGILGSFWVFERLLGFPFANLS
ncbi:HupE/UreJ family protein [uncultured Paraglaciecola sp.]|uniref:HupE/UreJ family protein n=1 Tax=uncultured Paraglaciecola sp. TaxID=1765024 RepID=UPI0030D91664|tara:strand:- start:13882 stop:14925 length:1044 start_codon:yes stop_codon:yes gene_type:complete